MYRNGSITNKAAVSVFSHIQQIIKDVLLARRWKRGYTVDPVPEIINTCFIELKQVEGPEFRVLINQLENGCARADKQ